MNSAKSSPARPGSAKPSPLRQGSTKSSPSLSQIDTLGRPLDSLGRPLDSSSSSSSDSSDSDSDFGEAKRSGVENTGLSLMSQDFSSEPVLPKRGGVLPSARPEPKHRKSAAQDSSSKSSHPFQPKTDILGDDLRLSDSDNSD
ncbi:uncharacterized protein LOC111718241 [Eurytemora carolleeae]|uniref:uncharacterized protein LOC111718241 n=1 Tax=Eurytemora carolleeae TaxID=1294199 RepID=UPI000C784DBB|nr:uncharacterized protein LOC111718241 [Eurytemora carolleeae]|eukprot:XP_023349557.1 uncharacterized protein LOC111718241 [Eurytemora affinis]